MNTVEKKKNEANIEKIVLRERESNIRSESRLHLYMNNWSTHSHTYITVNVHTSEYLLMVYR